MREKGQVVRLIGLKPFGFIRRQDGSEMFFHFNHYPRGQKPAVGDEVEFEVKTDPSKPTGRQEYADGITIITKAAATAHQAPATIAQPNTVSGLSVQFLYGQVRREPHFFELPVTVLVTMNGQPTAGAEVELLHNGSPIEFPHSMPTTPASGKAEFLVTYRNSDNDPDLLESQPDYIVALSALVKYRNASAAFSELYPKQNFQQGSVVTPQPQQAVPTPVPTPSSPMVDNITAEPMGYDRDSDAYYYKVRTSCGAQAISADIIVVSSLNLKVGFVQPGDNFVPAPAGEVTSGKNGLALIGVRLDGPKAQRGFIQFAAKDNVDIKTPELFVKTPRPAVP